MVHCSKVVQSQLLHERKPPFFDRIMKGFMKALRLSDYCHTCHTFICCWHPPHEGCKCGTRRKDEAVRSMGEVTHVDSKLQRLRLVTSASIASHAPTSTIPDGVISIMTAAVMLRQHAPVCHILLTCWQYQEPTEDYPIYQCSVSQQLQYCWV